MRTPLEYLIATAVAAIALLPSDGSAQADSILPASFHRGQWAAEVQVSGGPRGLAALRFRSPSTAWRIFAGVTASRSLNPGPDFTGFTLDTEAGKRWYGGARGRVRAYHGVGVITEVGAAWQSQVANTLNYQLGAYAEVGAQLFISRDISLGGRWSGTAAYARQSTHYDSGPDFHSSLVRLNAGRFELTGGFYF